MSQIVLDNQLAEAENALDNEWEAFAAREDRLERLLRLGRLIDDTDGRVVEDGLRLLAKQLRYNRTRRYRRQLAETGGVVD